MSERRANPRVRGPFEGFWDGAGPSGRPHRRPQRQRMLHRVDRFAENWPDRHGLNRAISGGQINLPAEVVYAETTHGFAVRFVDTPVEVANVLRKEIGQQAAPVTEPQDAQTPRPIPPRHDRRSRRHPGSVSRHGYRHPHIAIGLQVTPADCLDRRASGWRPCSGASSITTELQPGRHRVRVSNTLVWKTLEFDLAPGEQVFFEAINRTGPGTFLMLVDIRCRAPVLDASADGVSHEARRAISPLPGDIATMSAGFAVKL